MRRLEGIKVFAYADDIVIIAQSEVVLGDAIRKMKQFCTANYLKMNEDKSQIVKIVGSTKKNNI